MRRHSFDPISFVFGALFAAIGLTFLFGDADIGDLHIAVIWPLPLIVIGLLMLITTLQRRTRDEPAPVVPASVAAATRSEPAATEQLPEDHAFGVPETRHDLRLDEDDEGSPS